jgi:hypothetical protein
VDATSDVHFTKILRERREIAREARGYEFLLGSACGGQPFSGLDKPCEHRKRSLNNCFVNATRI